MHNHSKIVECDVVLIGAGVMSATLGVFLKELQPDWRIRIFERLDKVGAESSDSWNNAGTGHSGLCELNYAPQLKDGTVDISKAEKIVEMFEVSKQFWSYLTTHGYIDSPADFINSCPHMSLVWGDENVSYLRKRYEAMQAHHFFKSMQYSEDHGQLNEWAPLVMEGRDPQQKVAATCIEIGTDVNFGTLTRQLFARLSAQPGVELLLEHDVHHLRQEKNGKWLVEAKNHATGANEITEAKFVFIGAGGGALPLLERSGISEGKGFGGFPVSGEWLICRNQEVIERHHAKVYGKAAVGSPPMSVPHLDTRIINGKKELLFGPYAGFNTKFLKHGSLLDLPLSVRLDNIISMLGAGVHNIKLTEYLIQQARQTPEDRFKALQEFVPHARMEDWELAIAGQRVQIIKPDSKEGGVLEFGTEIVSHADGTIAALLGASPGASTSVSIMIDLLHQCFGSEMQSEAWQARLKEMIPTYGQSLKENPGLCAETRARTGRILGLHHEKQAAAEQPAKV